MIALRGLGLVIGLTLVAVAGASAQPPANRLYRIGVLDTAPLARNAANIEAFKQGLGELGYVARALGVTLPQTLTLRADHLIR